MPALAQTYAAQLIGLMPDVILAVSTTNLTAIRQVTSAVPVVFVQVSDPLAQGFVASLRQPGGNITGFGQIRILDRRQMARSAQGSCARARTGRRHVQPRHISPIPSSSCRRSRRPRHPSACRRSPCRFGLPPTSNPPWRSFARRAERRADPADRHLHAFALYVDRRPGGPLSACRRSPTGELCQGRRPDGLRRQHRFRRPIPTSGRLTSIASSRVKSPATCQSRRRTNTRSSSTSRPPRRSTSKSRPAFSPSRTRWSSSDEVNDWRRRAIQRPRRGFWIALRRQERCSQ